MTSLSEVLGSVPSSRKLTSPYLDYIAARREAEENKEIFSFIAILVDNSNDTWSLTAKKITSSLENALSEGHFTLNPIIDGYPSEKESQENPTYLISITRWDIVPGKVPLPNGVQKNQVISMIDQVLSQK